MRATATTAMVLTVAVFLAACGGVPQPASEATPPAAGPTATSEVTPDPTSSATPDATQSPSSTPEPTDSETAACEDGPPGTFTNSTASVSDDVRFLYLNDWEDLSGLVNFEAGSLLAEDTLADLGLEPGAKLKAQFVRGPSGFPNFSVFRFEGPQASSLDLADIYAREEARFAALPEMTELLQTEIEQCLDSEPALGMEFTFSAGSDELYQISFFTQHDGAIYHLQWLEERKGIVELLDEMLGSWDWLSPSGGSQGGSDDGSQIREVHVASVAPEAGTDPDPSSFTDSFASDVSRICVLAQVDVGVEDTVLVTWNVEGEPVFEQDRKIESGVGWVWFCIQDSDRFDAGNWSVNVEFAGSGDRKVASFKVEPSGTAGIPEVGVAEAWAADAREHRGKVGQDFQYACPPSGIPGAIWGTEIYTDDSSVCTAAVHDGMIDLDTGGTVTIEIQPGWPSYEASDQNGISSTAYPAWDGSFVFLP